MGRSLWSSVLPVAGNSTPQVRIRRAHHIGRDLSPMIWFSLDQSNKLVFVSPLLDLSVCLLFVVVSHLARFYLCKVGHVLLTQPHDRVLVFNRGFCKRYCQKKTKALPILTPSYISCESR